MLRTADRTLADEDFEVGWTQGEYGGSSGSNVYGVTPIRKLLPSHPRRWAGWNAAYGRLSSECS